MIFASFTGGFDMENRALAMYGCGAIHQSAVKNSLVKEVYNISTRVAFTGQIERTRGHAREDLDKIVQKSDLVAHIRRSP